MIKVILKNKNNNININNNSDSNYTQHQQWKAINTNENDTKCVFKVFQLHQGSSNGRFH